MLNLHVHIHALVADGVYVADEGAGAPRFVALEAPSDDAVAQLAETVAQRVTALLKRRNLIPGYGSLKFHLDVTPIGHSTTDS